MLANHSYVGQSTVLPLNVQITNEWILREFAKNIHDAQLNLNDHDQIKILT